MLEPILVYVSHFLFLISGITLTITALKIISHVMSSSRGGHFGLFLGTFWCVIFCFLRTIQYFFMK